MWELAKTTLYGRLLIIEPILLIALELCIPPSFSNDEIFIRNLDIFRYDGLYFFLKFCQCICTYLAAFFHLIKVLKTKQKKKKSTKITWFMTFSTPTWPGLCSLLWLTNQRNSKFSQLEVGWHGYLVNFFFLFKFIYSIFLHFIIYILFVVTASALTFPWDSTIILTLTFFFSLNKK